MNDLKFAFRQQLKHPGFTAVAVLTLAVGIGGTAAIFAVMNAHVLNPVPLKSDRRLVEIKESSRARQMKIWTSAPLYHDLVQQRDLFEEVVAFKHDALLVTGGEFLDAVNGVSVSPNFFKLFGVSPRLGRWLTAEEQTSAVEDVLVISHAAWQARFGGDPNVIGRTLKTKDATYTIIGVMPREFQFPTPITQFWRPFHFRADELSNPSQRSRRSYYTFAALAPNVSQSKVQAFLDTWGARLAKEFPRECKEWAIESRPLRDFFVAPEIRRILWSVALAIGFVLVIACANLANLQLSRTEARSKEIAVRMALGAGRRRLVRQLITESFLLSLAGGVGGLLIAVWLRQVLASLLPEGAPVVRPGGLDLTVLLWTFGMSVACAMAVGLYPAWRASSVRLSQSLKGTSAATSASAQKWFRHSLVVGEIALAMVLLTSAGLLVRSVFKILYLDPGLNPSRLASVTFQVRAGTGHQAAMRELATRLAALPGITAVGTGPISGVGSQGDFYLWERAAPVELGMNQVGVGECDFFRTIGARLKDGRWLQPADMAEGQSAVLINETFAAMCWPGEHAVGKRVYHNRDRSNDNPSGFLEVVGVVQDFHTWNLEWETLPCLFVPDGRSQRAGLGSTLYVRTTLDPASVITGVRRVAKEVLPNTVVPRIVWIEQQLYASTLTRRLFMGFLLAFAGVGLLLSLLGIFGVLTHAVVRRTNEIGVRMALGAQRADVLAQVLGEGMKLTSIGILIGLAGAFGLTRLMRSHLFGIGPTDAVTFFVVPLMLALAAMLACWLPARRAAKMDPMAALRCE
ncbi:MAG: ABC transporter permease [Verrucomicrobia bacterium]|nr:ABC transporter permease [Verrucomicrobiota bacterium]